MHPQTAAWLKDLDFTDSEEDIESPKSAPTETAETQNTAFAGSSPSRSQSLVCLPAEVLFAVIDLLDLPVLACFIQTCRDIRAACLTDAVWDRLCDHNVPKTNPHSRKYHKPTSTRITGTKQTAQHASKTSSAQSQTSSTSHSSGSKQHQLAHICHQPQIRHSFYDNKLNIKYSSGLVADPAWLSLLPKVSSPGSSWLYLKGKTLSDLTLKGCSPPFRHTHHHVRKELHSLWLKGEVGDSLLLQRTLLKLTRLSWSKAYETISNAFVYSSDCTALDLKTDYICSLPQDRSPTAEANNIWQSVLQVWQEYRTWVTRVCSLCTRLVECISAERAAEMMSRGKADTPTLFDMGKAAFRSQVVLAYGLRSALQTSWEALQSSARHNRQSVQDAHVLLDVTRLLQELDVADDGTKPAGYHTQERMREVFGLGEYRHEHARNLLQLQLCRDAKADRAR